MTTPIDPGDTEALMARLRDVTRFCGCDFRVIAEEMARALVPPGYSVVADDDLRRVIHMYNRTGQCGSVISDYVVLDRLRSALGDEG